MFKKTHISIIMAALLLPFVSCRDEELLEAETFMPESQYKNVYSLNFMVTLDNMGSGIDGTRGVTSNDPSSITKWENYIDLERFRILFFDENDNFLFESKNRWVKQIDVNDNFSSWYVNVPFGAFGNDSYEDGDYNWVAIREHLTKKRFKIAVLANRPAQLLYPGNFADSELQLPDGVFDNDGPYWGPKDVGTKNVFDLHHYQYDIIYADKGEHSAGASKSYYDFVMGDNNTDRPTMGSAINWVSFDNDDTDKVLLGGTTYMRHLKMPSADHPIPMYGIQMFEPIPAAEWEEGTPFDLSNEPSDMFPDESYSYTSIALLRSCVRLDLRIPKTLKNRVQPKFVTLWYSNIYSRTEPMDTWTPTDQIWNKDHNACEWKDILQYGPVSSNTYPGNGNDKTAYQSRISWFYGVWKEKGWGFKTRDNKTVTVAAEATGMKYPRIFNTCIQRNKVITCERGDKSSDYNDNYWHYVVYTGERNCNDPNTLPDMVKNPYIACFIISWDMTNFYCIPLLDYAKNTDSDAKNIFGPFNDGKVQGGNLPGAVATYVNTLASERGSNLPYPLLRNHIYRFTLTGTKATDDLSDISISSEVLQTPDINFTPQVKKAHVLKK